MTKDIVDFKKLNKEQREAVKYNPPAGGGPLLIIAGAGTGKTTVVTERIKYLITKEPAKPSEILALTFTEKAAREMEERVDIAMPYGYTQMWISTFHSFCDRILRAEALHIGLDPKYRLMAQAETIQFIRANLFKFKLNYFRPLGNPTKFVGGMLQHFSRLQDEDVSPSQYLKWAEAQGSKLKAKNKEEKEEIRKWLELAKAYKNYDELKVKEGFMDFGDLIVNTLKLFRRRPNILRQYKKQFKHVLVDEFQDTNISQYELIKLLAPPMKNGNLTVTGDDSQSIYKFRGAAISNILQFKRDYKKAKTVVLVKNYRSTQTILDSAYKLIQHNNPDTLESKLGIDKNLKSVTDPKGGEDVKFVHKDRVENEATEVAKVIKKLSDKGNYDYRDFAILVRANNHSEPFMRALSRTGVPFQFLGPGRLYKQSEVVDLISYLKVLYDFEDSVSLYRLLAIEYFETPALDLVKISNYAKRLNLTLFGACEKIDDIFVQKTTKVKVKKILKVIDRHLKLLKKETAGQLLYYFLEDTGLIQKLLNPDTPEAEKRAANISKFFDKLKTYEVDNEDATVSAVVDWIELSSELGESPLAADIDWTEVNAVNILTAHSAKGLEFPIVFLVNLVGQRFPTVHRREQIPIPDDLIKEMLPTGDFHEQEERRLFYVGMTRARERLFLTAANYYGEGKREKRLSPFIFEALGDKAVSAEKVVVDTEQLSFLDYSKDEEPLERPVTKQRPIHIDYLSYSQIATFKICPLHYKLRYIFRIPTPPSAALSFGSSIHAVLKDLYVNVAKGISPTEKLIFQLLEKNWMGEGYESKSHEKKMIKQGQDYLSGFLRYGFSAKRLPVAMEQPFVIPLVPPKGEKRLKIGGKIDRVDKMYGSRIEIIDYKTGANVPTQKQVDSDLQLTFYGLAVTKIKEPPFDKKPEDLFLSLYFFENQLKLSTKRSALQFREATKDIFEWRDKIEKSDFKCSKHMFCDNCEYSLLCRAD